MTSTKLKCPYCIAVRGSVSEMTNHMYYAHPFTGSKPDLRRIAQELYGESAETQKPELKCPYCPGAVTHVDDLTDHLYAMHAISGSKAFLRMVARDVQRGAAAASKPTDAPPTVDERLNAVGEDIAHLAKQVEDIDRRMTALDTPTPAQVRRRTLNEVLDILAIRKDYQGASIVRHLIERESDQS